MVKVKNLILGAGIAGLAAGKRLSELDQEYLVLEKENHAGGLCSSFNISGFDFDYFVHMSFTKNEVVRKYFDIVPYNTHIPNPHNYYHGTWIKHPAINNLLPLNKEEKDAILKSLESRDKYKDVKDDNYENWLRYKFGDYFAEHFPLVYNRKFWCVEASRMETKWAGDRVYQPTIKEIIEGMNTMDTPITYYSKEMRYPVKGGFETYLTNLLQGCKVRLGENVISIDQINKSVLTDKDSYKYERLFSSIPLTELGSLIKGVDDQFVHAISSLHWTSGYLVSLGINGRIPRTDLWDYIYDEDIDVPRFYSPSNMSERTVPPGCSSIQAEIYTEDGQKHILTPEQLIENTIKQLEKIGILDRRNVVVKDVRFSKYCNIIFCNDTYSKRDNAVRYLKKLGIIPIGRFGEWAYYWSDQSFLSGYNAVSMDTVG